VNLDELEQLVLDEIDSYRYEVSDDALGTPKRDEWVERQLAEMRAALVKPEWRLVQMQDTYLQMTSNTPEFRRCALVAEEADGCELYYDPLEDEFALAYGAVTIGVRGDAVGCFMAR